MEVCETSDNTFLVKVPDDVITKARFDSIAAFLIPKREMLDRLIKINLDDVKIMTYPVGLG